MIHIFEIPEPNLPIHFVSVRALRRRLSHVRGKNRHILRKIRLGV